MNMNTREYLVPICDTVTNPEIPWNEQMSTPTLKQEITCIDASSSNSSHSVYIPEQVQSSACENYYDNKIDVLEQIKKEFPEDNEEFRLIDKEIKRENTDEDTSLDIKKDDYKLEFEINIKAERQEQEEVLYNDGDIKENSDVLGAPQEIEYKFDDKTVKNSLDQNKLTCELCGKEYKKLGNLQRHIQVVHSDQNHVNEVIQNGVKCTLCNADFESVYKLVIHRKLCNAAKNVDEAEMTRYVCDFCGGDYKNEPNLIAHMKGMHHDYGKSFDCWCGKQFRTPKYLSKHMALHKKKTERRGLKCEHCESVFYYNQSLKIHTKRMHSKYDETFKCWCGKEFRSPIDLRGHEKRNHSKIGNVNNDKFQCKTCDKVFKLKTSLLVHIKRKHYDYGRIFECCCGKKFPSPVLLSEHKTRWHNSKFDKSNNKKLKCEHCLKIFKGTVNLAAHIKRSHYDCGKIFECTCGKQFFTPKDLLLHQKRQKAKGQDAKDDKFQCESCQAFFKTKPSLIYHIKKIHYDYGRMFECWCGKKFRSPIHLCLHKNKEHKAMNKNNEQYQCDSCQKVFNNKKSLFMHIKRNHYDYGRMFECWCGEQFSSPKLLSEHNTRWHKRNREKPNDKKFKCDSCLKLFKGKRSLVEHIKKFHYDYGKVFECWCGKEFRSPILLRDHKRYRHDRASQTSSNATRV